VRLYAVTGCAVPDSQMDIIFVVVSTVPLTGAISHLVIVSSALSGTDCSFSVALSVHKQSL
jgi:hypothetical protein